MGGIVSLVPGSLAAASAGGTMDLHLLHAPAVWLFAILAAGTSAQLMARVARQDDGDGP